MNAPVRPPNIRDSVEIISQVDKDRPERTGYCLIGPSFEAVQAVIDDFHAETLAVKTRFWTPKWIDGAWVSNGEVHRRKGS